MCMNVARDDSDEKRRKRSCQEGKEEQMREKGKRKQGIITELPPPFKYR